MFASKEPGRAWWGVLATSVLCCITVAAAHAAESPTDEGTRRTEAMAEMETARVSLAEMRSQIDEVELELTEKYRVLDRIVRREKGRGEPEARAEISALKDKRDRLWLDRDRAKLVLQHREAVFDSADAMYRVSELRSSGGVADSPEIQSWLKKHEKAEARARRLIKLLDEGVSG